MKKMKHCLLITLFAPLLAFAAGGGVTYPDKPFKADVFNQESLQNGARLYINYCLGCHSLKYQRYNRLAKDAGLDIEVVQENLIFTGAKPGETILNALPHVQAEEWFGKVPPDLSLIGRSKGSDYVYNYLQGFYIDSSKGTGVNNSVFADVAMPNVLEVLEGTKKPVWETSLNETCLEEFGDNPSEEDKKKCEEHHVAGFEQVTKGTMTEDEFASAAYDLANFLNYVGDPSQIQRYTLGWKVILFLIFMTAVFYILKKEYWRDVH